MKGTAGLIFEKIIQGDRVALGQAMTLVESDRLDERESAISLLEKCEQKISSETRPVRLTLSGAPGAGKSTLIEALGMRAIQDGFRVGVLTIDPTSTISHGSILGDKSRMTRLSNSSQAFIRSSAAGEVLGGMSRRTPEMMTLLSAAGYELILLETVGVGQSEHLAWQFTDGFILVIQPGGGDELQGIKRGITELADIVIVNKADGALSELARLTKSQYQNALHFFSSTRSGWSPKIVTCSALMGDGIDDVWNVIRLYKERLDANPEIEAERMAENKAWLTWSLAQTAKELIMHHPVIEKKLSAAMTRMKADHPSWYRTEYEIERAMRILIDHVDQNPATTKEI